MSLHTTSTSALLESCEHGFLENNGVKLHYATMGSGPLVLMLHGFPDFWYTWRNQMPALAKDFKVVALDLRGYNLSDKPKGSENYQMKTLISDVAAAIKHFGERRATIIGHDWGGAIAWATAIFMPVLVKKLVVLNISHPSMMHRELCTNPAQRKASEYAQAFKKPGSHKAVSAESLCQWVTDAEARPKYLEAFNNSDIECILAYYTNFPDEPYEQNEKPSGLPKVRCPVLQIFGLNDQYVLSSGLNGTAQEVNAEYTLVTLPEAGHFVQHDAPEAVTRIISNWLATHS